MIRRQFRVLLVTVATLLATNAAFARAARGIDAATFDRLNAPLREKSQIRIPNVPLADERPETLVLEPFDVLAPNAVIEVFDANGKPARVVPQTMRQFRGHVEGDPSSLVFITMSDGRKVGGLIITRERKFTLARRVQDQAGINDEIDINEVPLDDEYDLGTGYTCDVEGTPIAPVRGLVPESLVAGGKVASEAYSWPTETAVTVLNMVVESDSALYANFGNNATAVETFLRNLIAATSTIYHRDLRTDLRISYLGIRTTTDPWNVNPGTSGTWNAASTTYSSTHALLEYGDYWHNSAPTALNNRSHAMLVSGQSQMAGVAWIQTACGGEFALGSNYGEPYVGHYGGPYAYCGGVGIGSGDRTVPNPDALANFATPSNYWPLMEVAHELGHSVQSKHTHCTTLSIADQGTYGRSFVDNCNASGSGCYTGTTSLPLDGAGGRGTLMSYCHLIAGASGSRFTFGQPGEASHTIVDLMRARLDAITPTGLSAITAPASLASGASGNASVTNNATLLYSWTIENGSITGGQGTSAITFTATTNPVTLTVMAKNGSGCAVSDTKSVAVTASSTPPAAPGALIADRAGATTINVAWSSVSGATGYELWRKDAGGSYAKIADTTNPLYTDTVTTNTAHSYEARAINSDGITGAFSPADIAVAYPITDAALVNIVVKAAHINELRSAANALRALAGLGSYSFTDTITTGLQIRANHVLQLRTAIDEARTAIGGLGLVGYQTITPGTTKVRALDITDLRAGLQ